MPNDPMAEIRVSFFLECDELVESLQDALNVLDSDEGDAETINVVFRAVHSIKGGAGAFGLDALVRFAHRFETVMDEVRAGNLDLTPAALKLFFRAADMLQDQIRTARDGEDEPAGAAAVIAELETLLQDSPADEEEAVDFVPTGLSFDFSDDANDGELSEPGWQIRFAPSAELYTSGNEPLLILRSLSELGNATITCEIPDDLPAPNDSNAETPLLSWLVYLHGDVTEADISQVFDFVSDVCTLQVTETTIPPESAHVGTELLLSSPENAHLLDLPEPPEMAVETVDEKQNATPHPAAPTSEQISVPAKPVTRPTKEPLATVRVDLEKIDRLVNLVGELVINQAMLAQSVEEAGIGHQPDVMAGLESFMLLTRDIQESVMMIRAQPVKSLFQRMGRIVREASASVGKEVRLRTEGEFTEVDKTVIERLADPLTHMIRNAVDHGLETPEKRLASGKSREGVILLSASHRAGRVMIEVEDDGAGINREKVRDVAIHKGLIASDTQLNDSEVDNLLFMPGFSTATEVSELSGRGVGMDVVKSEITTLGGRISITSAPGAGTKLSISLPLTLAVLDGMVVQAADQTLVVPLSAIIETAKLQDAEIQRLAGSGEIMRVRGEFVPLFDLGRQLGFRDARDPTRQGIVLLTSQDDGRRAALIVDAIMEQRQVVIKGLGQSYGNIPGVAAATILGDGKIALILDPADLVDAGNVFSGNELKAVG
ncbi:chemotaxis protein CheA [Paracoccus aerodenitrificans]|uniref:chemotaxis protein CheA n=1 Tax=Paracoccus aerodenitrificans TaxID=3017781 RepID=UPI0022F11039|nr:chemotaxis protein CheA [Paracoccus aerodenitrificans]WBU62799.1 chemotaxis protein CheA [Paracoccus aerodenitrificans]